MADERSGLWGEVVRVLDVQSPRWFLGENVPGILSVNDGEDWAAILADLGRLGYGFAYRVLDAQWFGVPQRRRRVFVVGCLGDWRRAAEILFESESLPWDSPPLRQTGARTAASLTRGSAKGVGVNEPGRRCEDDVNLVAHPLKVPHKGAAWKADGGDNLVFQCHGSNVGEMGTLRRGSGGLTSGVPFVSGTTGVRRLMPIECERLQGFPDDWTRYGADGEEMADSSRYRMCGNAVAVPCVEWIANRLLASP